MKLVFSSVFETDFAAGVEYLAREASEEIATRWEKSILKHVAQKHDSNHFLGVRYESDVFFPH